MNKHDWVFVGMRLFGVYFLVLAALALPELLGLLFDGGVTFMGFVGFVVRIVVSWLLAAKTDTVSAWLGIPKAA